MSSNYQTSQSSFWGFIKETIETIVIVLVLVILIRNFIGEPRWIPSGSMRPTLLEGDRIFIEKVSNYLSVPKRGDIIVFYPPFEELEQDPWSIFTRLVGFFNKDIAYIKRVVGMPGDTIEIKTNPNTAEGKVFINGKQLKEPYTNGSGSIPCRSDMYCGPMEVPEDSYFMMGDNRANSRDSRFWGFLKKDRIIGRAVFRFWPLNRVDVIKTPTFEVDKDKTEAEDTKLDKALSYINELIPIQNAE